MQLHSLSIVLLRLLSIFFFMKGIELGAQFLPLLFPDVQELLVDHVYTYVLPSILYALILFGSSIFLWMKAGLVAGWVTRSASNGEQGISSMDLQGWSKLILTVTGILIALWALPSVLQQSGRLYYYANIATISTVSDQQRIETWMLWSAAIVQLLVGLLLFIRAEGIYGMILKFRDVGLKRGKEE